MLFVGRLGKYFEGVGVMKSPSLSRVMPLRSSWRRYWISVLNNWWGLFALLKNVYLFYKFLRLASSPWIMIPLESYFSRWSAFLKYNNTVKIQSSLNISCFWKSFYNIYVNYVTARQIVDTNILSFEQN